MDQTHPQGAGPFVSAPWANRTHQSPSGFDRDQDEVTEKVEELTPATTASHDWPENRNAALKQGCNHQLQNRIGLKQTHEMRP